MKKAIQNSQDKNALLMLSIVLGWAVEMPLLRAICRHDDQMILVIVSLALTLCMSMVIYRTLNLLPFSQKAEAKSISPLLYTITSIVVLTGLAVGGIARHLTEYQNHVMKWLGNPTYWLSEATLYFFPICIFVFIAVLFLYKNVKESQQIPRIVCYAFYCIAVFLCGLFLYVPNLFGSDSYHITASNQSIYNVAFNIPFSKVTTGIYGHYAIFFWPFLKLFGHRADTVALMIAAVAIVTEALALYVIDHVLSRPFLKIIAAIASVMPIVSIYNRVYYQVHPLRTLPPVLLLAYCVFFSKRKNASTAKFIIYGYLLCSLCIVWVTDIGAITTIAFSIFTCVSALRKYLLCSKQVMRIVLICIAGCFMSVFGMILIINFYNVIIAGGNLIFRSCFFPFIGGNIGENSFSQYLMIPLQWGNFSWIWVLALFFTGIMISIRKTSLLENSTSDEPLLLPDSILCFSSVIALGQVMYYLNRSVYWNLTIIIAEAVICMSILIEKGTNYCIEHQCSISGAVVSGIVFSILFELSFLICGTFSFTATSLQDRINAGQYSLDRMYRTAEEIERSVPADTPAYGYGIEEMYSLLGWDSQFHVRDLSDLAIGDAPAEISQRINDLNAVLVAGSALDLLDMESGWKQEKEIYVEEGVPATFYYYVKQ